MIKRTGRLLLPLLLATLFMAGCGRRGSDLDTQFVEGIVKLDGTPIEGVTLRFIPKNPEVGEEAGGISDAGGSYRLSSLRGDPGKGALEGEYIVLASKSEVVELPQPRLNRETGDYVTSELKPIIPAVYQDAAKTKLTKTVVRGKNKIDIELESSPSF